MAEVPDHIEPILKRALSPEQNLRHKDAQMLLEELVF
jgi:hypothetical protein